MEGDQSTGCWLHRPLALIQPTHRHTRCAAGLAALLPLIPDDRLLLETDAPYLTPRSITPAKGRPQRRAGCSGRAGLRGCGWVMAAAA